MRKYLASAEFGMRTLPLFPSDTGNVMTNYVGSCLCGAVAFEIEAEFESFYLCHCKYCQKDTGSAFAANLFCQTGKLIWCSGEDNISSFTLAGSQHQKSFCKDCGTALPNNHSSGILVVPAGCLDTDVAVIPTAHIFMSSKASWESNVVNIIKLEGLPE